MIATTILNFNYLHNIIRSMGYYDYKIWYVADIKKFHSEGRLLSNSEDFQAMVDLGLKKRLVNIIIQHTNYAATHPTGKKKKNVTNLSPIKKVCLCRLRYLDF